MRQLIKEKLRNWASSIDVNQRDKHIYQNMDVLKM